MRQGIFISILFLLFFFNFKCENMLNADMLESFNRRMYAFNRGVDRVLLMPSTSFYIDVVPDVIDNGIDNFLKNISECQNFFLNLVTFKLDDLCSGLSRLVINSTFGFCGFVDLSANVNIFYKFFDFNSVFGFYKSRYMMLPIVGPGTIKSNIYLLFIQLLNPCVYLFDKLFIYYFFEVINKKSQIVFDSDFFHKNMVDGYSFLKDIYMQNIGFKEIEHDFFLEEPPD